MSHDDGRPQTQESTREDAQPGTSYTVGDPPRHIYRGRCDPTGKGAAVTVDGEPLLRRYDLLSASPSGFEYGYGGSGPAQLAVAMLAHAYGDGFAFAHYQQFKREVIAELPETGWTLRTRDLDAWREVFCDD